MDTEESVFTTVSSLTDPDSSSSSGSASYLQRRLHPERQAVNTEELFELLKDDELARSRAEEDEEESTESAAPNHCDGETLRRRIDQVELAALEKDPQNVSVEERESCEEKSATSAEIRESDSNEGER